MFRIDASYDSVFIILAQSFVSEPDTCQHSFLTTDAGCDSNWRLGHGAVRLPAPRGLMGCTLMKMSSDINPFNTMDDTSGFCYNKIRGEANAIDNDESQNGAGDP